MDMGKYALFMFTAIQDAPFVGFRDLSLLLVTSTGLLAAL